VQEIVRSIRNLRAEKGVAPSRRIATTIAAGSKMDLLKEQSRVLAALAGLSESELTIVPSLTENFWQATLPGKLLLHWYKKNAISSRLIKRPQKKSKHS
jgi:valyl-tRNA synthetase